MKLPLEWLFIVVKEKHKVILSQMLHREAFIALKAGDAEKPIQVQVSINLGHIAFHLLGFISVLFPGLYFPLLSFHHCFWLSGLRSL